MREINFCNYYREQHHDINRYIFVNYRIIVTQAQINVKQNFTTFLNC